MIVNRAQLADILGVSLPTIDAWVKEGCPIEARPGRGKASSFDTTKVVKWVKEREVEKASGSSSDDDDEIERRTKRAKMLTAELELAKARGDVAPIAEFERVQAARAAMVRANIMNVPSRAVLQLLGETDETTFKRKLKEELILALTTAEETPVELSENDEAKDDA